MSDRRREILDAAISVIARTGVRGLRVDQVAAEAGVAVSLLYYYFGSRSGLVRATLDHSNERAVASGRAGEGQSETGREFVERMLLAELDDADAVREASIVWGEVVACAVFEPDLREQLLAASDTWVELVTSAVDTGREDGSIGADVDAAATAERLTALVEGLSSRWLAGLTTRERARELLAEAVSAELRPVAEGEEPTRRR